MIYCCHLHLRLSQHLKVRVNSAICGRVAKPKFVQLIFFTVNTALYNGAPSCKMLFLDWSVADGERKLWRKMDLFCAAILRLNSSEIAPSEKENQIKPQSGNHTSNQYGMLLNSYLSKSVNHYYEYLH